MRESDIAPRTAAMPAHAGRGDIDVAATSIAYWQEGTGRDLILLHGYACASRDWATVARLLCDRWRVLRFDFPAHGASGGQPPLSLADLVDCMAAVAQRLCDGVPVLVGHSMGGMVAMTYALQGRGRLGGLVLADAFPHLGSVVEVFGGPEDPDDPYGYGSVFDHRTPQDIVTYVRGEMRLGIPRAGPDLFASLLRFDARPTVGRLPCPARLLLGNRRWVDTADLPAVLDRLGYAGVPGFDALLVDSHHFVMLEQPDMVARAIGDFCMTKALA